MEPSGTWSLSQLCQCRLKTDDGSLICFSWTYFEQLAAQAFGTREGGLIFGLEKCLAAGIFFSPKNFNLLSLIFKKIKKAGNGEGGSHLFEGENIGEMVQDGLRVT